MIPQRRAFPARSGAIERSCKKRISEELEDAELEERARECEQLDQHPRAERIRSCGLYGGRRCHDRSCPSCARAKASKRGRLALFALGGFTHRLFVTLTLPSRGPFALGATLSDKRKFLLTWRRRSVVASAIAGGVGGIEPHLDRERVLWAVHSHLVLDSRVPELDFAPLAEQWDAITGGRGRLLIPNGGPEVRSPSRAAAYITKSDDSCPLPGAIPLRALSVLMGFAPAEAVERRDAGIRGKRLFIAWGTGRRACPE